jgi:hypothetical protein
VARMGKTRSTYRFSVGQPEVKRPVGRPRRREGYNIKRDLQEIGGMNWINLTQVRDKWWSVVNMVMNIPVP